MPRRRASSRRAAAAGAGAGAEGAAAAKVAAYFPAAKPGAADRVAKPKAAATDSSPPTTRPPLRLARPAAPAPVGAAPGCDTEDPSQSSSVGTHPLQPPASADPPAAVSPARRRIQQLAERHPTPRLSSPERAPAAAAATSSAAAAAAAASSSPERAVSPASSPLVPASPAARALALLSSPLSGNADARPALEPRRQAASLAAATAFGGQRAVRGRKRSRADVLRDAIRSASISAPKKRSRGTPPDDTALESDNRPSSSPGRSAAKPSASTFLSSSSTASPSSSVRDRARAMVGWSSLSSEPTSPVRPSPGPADNAVAVVSAPLPSAASDRARAFLLGSGAKRSAASAALSSARLDAAPAPAAAAARTSLLGESSAAIRARAILSYPTSRPALHLPAKYLHLLKQFEAIDWTISWLHNRSKPQTYDNIKQQVERKTRSTLTEKHIRQIITVAPRAFDFALTGGRPKPGSAVAAAAVQEEKLLILRNDDMPLGPEVLGREARPEQSDNRSRDGVIFDRKMEFQRRLLDITMGHHEAFLVSNSRLTVPRDQLRRWAPDFAVHDVPDIPESSDDPFPRKRHAKSSLELFEAMGVGGDSSAAAAVVSDSARRAVARVAASRMPDTAVAATGKMPSPQLPSDARRVAPDVHERVQLRQRHRDARELIRSEPVNLRRNRLAALPDLVRSIHFITSKSPSQPIIDLAATVSRSIPKAPAQILRDLELLATELPFWCSIHVVDAKTYFKTEKGTPLQSLLDALSQKMAPEHS